MKHRVRPTKHQLSVDSLKTEPSGDRNTGSVFCEPIIVTGWPPRPVACDEEITATIRDTGDRLGDQAEAVRLQAQTRARVGDRGHDVVGITYPGNLAVCPHGGTRRRIADGCKIKTRAGAGGIAGHEDIAGGVGRNGIGPVPTVGRAMIAIRPQCDAGTGVGDGGIPVGISEWARAPRTSRQARQIQSA